MTKNKKLLIGGLVATAAVGTVVGVVVPLTIGSKNNKGSDADKIQNLINEMESAKTEDQAKILARTLYNVDQNEDTEMTKSADAFGAYVFENKDTKDFKANTKTNKNAPNQVLIAIYDKNKKASAGSKGASATNQIYADSAEWFVSKTVDAEFSIMQNFINDKVAYTEFIAGKTKVDPTTGINNVMSKDWAIYKIYMAAFAKEDWGKTYIGYDLEKLANDEEKAKEYLASLIYSVSGYETPTYTPKYEGLVEGDLKQYISSDIDISNEKMTVKVTLGNLKWEKELTGIKGTTATKIATWLKTNRDTLNLEAKDGEVIPTQDEMPKNAAELIAILKDGKGKTDLSVEVGDNTSIIEFKITNMTVDSATNSITLTYTLTAKDGTTIVVGEETGTINVTGFITEGDAVASAITGEEVIAEIIAAKGAPDPTALASDYDFPTTVNVTKEVGGADVVFTVTLTKGAVNNNAGSIAFTWKITKNAKMTKDTAEQSSTLSGFLKTKTDADLIADIQTKLDANTSINVKNQLDTDPTTVSEADIKAIIITKTDTLPVGATMTLSNRDDGDGEISVIVKVELGSSATTEVSITISGYKSYERIQTDAIEAVQNSFEEAIKTGGFGNTHSYEQVLTGNPAFPQTPYNLAALVTALGKTFTNTNDKVEISIKAGTADVNNGAQTYTITFTYIGTTKKIVSTIIVKGYKTATMSTVEAITSKNISDAIKTASTFDENTEVSAWTKPATIDVTANGKTFEITITFANPDIFKGSIEYTITKVVVKGETTDYISNIKIPKDNVVLGGFKTNLTNQEKIDGINVEIDAAAKTEFDVAAIDGVNPMDATVDNVKTYVEGIIEQIVANPFAATLEITSIDSKNEIDGSVTVIAKYTLGGISSKNITITLKGFQTLDQYKAAKVADINTYFNGKDTTSFKDDKVTYNDAITAAWTSAKTAAETAINAVTTRAEVDTAFNTAKTNIDGALKTFTDAIKAANAKFYIDKAKAKIVAELGDGLTDKALKLASEFSTKPVNGKISVEGKDVAYTVKTWTPQDGKMEFTVEFTYDETKVDHSGEITGFLTQSKKDENNATTILDGIKKGDDVTVNAASLAAVAIDTVLDTTAAGKLNITLPDTNNITDVTITFSHPGLSADGNLTISIKVKVGSAEKTKDITIAVSGIDAFKNKKAADSAITAAKEKFDPLANATDGTTSTLTDHETISPSTLVSKTTPAELGFVEPSGLGTGITVVYTATANDKEGTLEVTATISKTNGDDQTVTFTIKGYQTDDDKALAKADAEVDAEVAALKTDATGKVEKGNTNPDWNTTPTAADITLTEHDGFKYKFKSASTINDNGESTVTIEVTKDSPAGVKTVDVQITISGFQTKEEHTKAATQKAINDYAAALSTKITIKAGSDSKTASEMTKNDLEAAADPKLKITIDRAPISKTTTDGTTVTVTVKIESTDSTDGTISKEVDVEIDGFTATVVRAKGLALTVVEGINETAILGLSSVDKTKTVAEIIANEAAIQTAIRGLTSTDTGPKDDIKKAMQDLFDNLTIKVEKTSGQGDGSITVTLDTKALGGTTDKVITINGFLTIDGKAKELVKSLVAAVSDADISGVTAIDKAKSATYNITNNKDAIITAIKALFIVDTTLLPALKGAMQTFINGLGITLANNGTDESKMIITLEVTDLGANANRDVTVTGLKP